MEHECRLKTVTPAEGREAERSEGEWAGAGVTGRRAEVVVVADPEVPEKARRRRFSAEYKLRVLEEADACSESGEIGALLRREGLYSSHLVVWRRQRTEGTLHPASGGERPSRRTRWQRRSRSSSGRIDASRGG